MGSPEDCRRSKWLCSPYAAGSECGAKGGASRLLCAASPWRLRELEVHCANSSRTGLGAELSHSRRHKMNLKLLRFFVVSLAAAMSLTALAAVLAQLTQTGTETAASSFLSRTALAQTAPKAKNVVLVHGLFADGSSWSEVIPRLQAAGLNVTCVQNPLTTFPEAVDAALRVLGRQNGLTVLAGHSFSGMIVTEAGVHPNVSALVYVAARAPDAGEDYTALAKTFPTPPATAGIVFDGDEGRLTEEAFLRDFAGDLPEVKAKVLYAVQEPFHKALLTGKTTHAAWRSKPSYYAVSTEDRTIDPDLQRFMAKRMGARTIEVKASHLSLISHPDEITGLILEAAGQQA